MRFIHSVLILSFFLLGVGIVLVASRLDLACLAEGGREGWQGSERCASGISTMEEDREPAEAAAEPLVRDMRAGRRSSSDDLLSAAPGAGDEWLEPTVVQARAPERPALEVLPFDSRMSERAALVAAGDPAAGRADEPSGPNLVVAQPLAARVPEPMRLTSVPVPRDPEEARRLLAERYPPELKETGVGGTVVLSLRIDRQGRVRDPQVVSGSGHERLDFAALEVVRALRFTAAQQEGRSVETRVLHPLVFRP